MKVTSIVVLALLAASTEAVNLKQTALVKNNIAVNNFAIKAHKDDEKDDKKKDDDKKDDDKKDDKEEKKSFVESGIDTRHSFAEVKHAIHADMGHAHAKANEV